MIYCDLQVLVVVNCDHQDCYLFFFFWLCTYPFCVEVIVIEFWLSAYPSCVEVIVVEFWLCAYPSYVEVIMVWLCALSLLCRGGCI